jgi:hypothetical protein
MGESSQTDNAHPQPGWYPDASAPGTWRWWDGQAWSPHTATASDLQSWTGPPAPMTATVKLRKESSPFPATVDRLPSARGPSRKARWLAPRMRRAAERFLEPGEALLAYASSGPVVRNPWLLAFPIAIIVAIPLLTGYFIYGGFIGWVLIGAIVGSLVTVMKEKVLRGRDGSADPDYRSLSVR